MGRRHYPPAVIIHVPHCIEGHLFPALSIRSVPESLPNHRLHFCFPPEFMEKPITEIAAIGTYPMVTWEKPAYPDHSYAPDKTGRQLPPDAIDYPCRICRGTHGDEVDELLGVPPRP